MSAKRSLAYILFVISLLLTSYASRATHIVGVDLSYSWISGSTYKISLTVYGDCAGAAFPSLTSSAPVVCIYDGNTSVSSVTLALQPPTNGVEITPVCPADSNKTQCTNLSYTIPGIKKFVYTANYTLPYTSTVWRFLFTGSMGGSSSAGRGSGITNIVTPGSTIIQLVDTLNNTTFNNNSPSLTILPTPFFCLNNPDTYNPGASDMDGDSLRFSLVSAIDGTTSCSTLGTPVTYVSPYTPTAPLAATGFSFNAQTGQIIFTPNILQRSLVVYNIDEYRGTTKVGTCQREMTFLVLTCTSGSPWGGYTSSTTGTIIDSTDYSVCSNVGAFSITMTPKEADTSNNINVTATGLPPGVTFTTANNNTNHPLCTVSGNTSSLPPGTYIFYVTFKDNACPLNGLRTQAFTIVVLPSPVVTAGPDTTFCAGNSVTLTATGASSYKWSPGSGLSCTLCSSTIATPSSTTVYTVTGTASNGCTATDTARVTVLPLPVLITGTTAGICKGNSAPLSVSGAASYLWSPSGSLSCSTCTNPVATPTVTTTYSVTGTAANGCISTGGVTITVNPLPVVTVAPAAICSGKSATLAPSGAISYVWSPPTGLSCTSCTNPVTTTTVTTTYTVTGTDVNGCMNTATVTVTVGATPPPPAVVTPVSYCQNATAVPLVATGTSLLWYTTLIGGVGSSVAPTPSTAIVGSAKWYVSQTIGACESDRDSITVNILPLPSVILSPAAPAICIGGDTTLAASGASSYTWTPSSTLSSSTGSSVLAAPFSSTTYTVVGVGSNGCSNTATITVTVHSLPVVTAGPSTAICQGSSAILTGGGAVSYVWTPALTLSSTSGSPVTATPTVTTTYTVIGTDAFTCMNSATATVTVNPIPAPPTVVTPVVYCVNATASPLAALGTSLLWYTVPVGGSSSPVAPVPSTSVAGTFNWYVSQTISGCESPRDTITVVVNPLPAVVITPAAAEICIGGDTTLHASGALTYSWAPSTGLSSVSGPAVSATPSATTTYTVTGTDVNGCTNTDTRMVVVHPLPVITVPSVGICINTSATLTASGATTYVWSPASSLSSSSGTTVVASPSVTSTYNITGTDGFGCVGYAVTTVTVSPVPPAPDAVSPVFYCQHAPARALTASGSNLLWYTSVTGGIGSSAAPVPGTDNIDTNYWYVSQSVNGCEGPRDTVKVIVMVNAVTDFDYDVRYGCIYDTVYFTNKSQFTYRYLWYFGDNTSDTATNPVHLYTPVKETADIGVMMYGYNEYCYPDSTYKTITLHRTPSFTLVHVTPGQTIPYGTTLQLNADGAISYEWTPDNSTLSDRFIHDPIAKPVDDITYTVTGIDARGCVDTALVTITIEYDDDPVIPTAFTPNGDGETMWCVFST